MGSHTTEACLPHQPGHVGCMAPRRKPHLCSEALNPRGELALPLRGAALVGAALPRKRRERLASSDPCRYTYPRAGGRSGHPAHPRVTIMAFQRNVNVNVLPQPTNRK